MKITHVKVMDTYAGEELHHLTVYVVLDGVLNLQVEVSTDPEPVFTFPVGVTFSSDEVVEKFKEQITKHVAHYRTAQLLEEIK